MWNYSLFAKERGVKHRTTSLVKSGPHHHPLPLFNPPPAHPTQTATSEEVLLVLCRRAAKQALLSAGELTGMNLSPNNPPELHESVCLHLFLPPNSLLACFSSEGKLKLVMFVFLLVLAGCLLLKPRC